MEASNRQKSWEWFLMLRWTSSCMTTYSTKDASSIMTRQLNLNVPSGAQLPQRWRWSRMSIFGSPPLPRRGHQR